MGLPRMDGWEVARRLRADPELASIPLVAITVLDLLSRVDELDDELLNGVLVSHSSGIEVLVAPEYSEASGPGDAAPLKTLLAWLRGPFDYAVVDAPLFPGEHALAALSVADMALLITTPDVLSVRRARLFFEAAASLECLPAFPLIVLNRHDRKSGVTTKDIEKALKRKVCTQMPNDYELVMHSVNDGVPFVLSHRRHALSKSLFALAKTIRDETDLASDASAASPSGCCSQVVVPPAVTVRHP
jgi:pilus assembly protein CpaE